MTVRAPAIVFLTLLAAMAGCAPTEPFPPIESDSSVVTTEAPTPTQDSVETEDPVPSSITRSELFGSGVVDLLNEVDLGDRSDLVRVCQGVGEAVAGMSANEIDRATEPMTDYDRSILQDLVAECGAL